MFLIRPKASYFPDKCELSPENEKNGIMTLRLQKQIYYWKKNLNNNNKNQKAIFIFA